NAIPEFDNLYLDMNGIIHNCSLPNESDAHFRMSEDKIFLSIFNYIDHLFMKIKPQKVFFMALDGVAPRAKMNQQRSRRFRTAKDAEDARRKAISKGEQLPEEDPFDRNCITPGTPFMKRLSAQLEFFISKKMTEDASWHNVKVILSGHEVPGEGEHKIMEFIRLSKAQKDYHPNTRHCLYGLDADLIMLGLLSHEPHFALLREEITFGKNKKKGGLDTQNFFLLHLSLLREYLDLEFNSLESTLPFPYDLERIIDDFVLMCLFVGNDFLPHLPHLHIAEGALSLLFKIYKDLLPTAGGYLHDSGVLDHRRVETMIHQLTEVVEHEAFEIECDDLRYLGNKKAEQLITSGSTQKSNGKNKQGTRTGKPVESSNDIVLTRRQKDLYDQIKEFVLERKETYHFPKTLNASDKRFIKKVANAIEIRFGVETEQPGGEKHIYIEFDEEEDEEDNESQEARARVMLKYDQAKIVENTIENEKQRDEKAKAVYQERYMEWKKEYYQDKPELDTPEEVRTMVFKYIEGVQWVLYYYYRGVASWAWFYPYHYAPKMSDLANLEEFKIPFELGEPFKPYEQLMGVLPEASKQHIPRAYWDLITKELSPIRDFYPRDFDLDMNGKKHDWEAVIKIPFIDQDRLLEAMKTREHLLSEEEVERNGHGESAMFTRDDSLLETYPSPAHFPDIRDCKCRREVFHLPVIEGVSSLKKGLCEGALTHANGLFGFPSMHTLKHSGCLGFHEVRVFQMPSRNESMVVTLESRFNDIQPEQLALSKIGKKVYVGWPFLKEGVVSSISDEMFKYEIQVQGKKRVVVQTPHRTGTFESWKKRADKIETVYSSRFGVSIGEIEFTAQVLLLKGLRRELTGALVKVFCKPEEEQDFAIQTIVEHVEHSDTRTQEQNPRPLNEEYPIGSHVFFLGQGSHYGAPAQVIAHVDNALALNIFIPIDNRGEPTFGHEIVNEALGSAVYLPGYVVCKKVGISGIILSKLSSSLHVVYRSTDRRVNLGLNLKFEGKKQKVLGYSRKTDSGWEYSQKAVDLLQEYKQQFPEFIAGLEMKVREDYYIAEEMYPEGDSTTKIKKIEDWLKKSKVKDLERVDLDAMQLDKETIARLEEAADEHVDNRPIMKHIIVKNISRHTMLKPSYAATLLTDQTFQLGDRVAFVQDSGTVPIAAKGTVVGIDRLEIEILFDDMFMSGMDLGGRCSMHRGMTVGRQSILNISNPQCNQKQPTTVPPESSRPRPTAIIQRPDLYWGSTDDGIRGWEIM
ncbi:5'-3' exoribonuclease 1, partial [Modicella reniformis]